MDGYVARAERDVAAPAEEIWGLLTAEASRVYFGAQVESDWQVITHYSPLSGEEDRPENYHRMEYLLSEAGGGTHVVLEQDGNPTQDAADHAAANWQKMLDGLAEIAEQG